MKNKKNYFSFLISHFSFPQKGFTLIELMVVLSITAVLGTLGIAGFTTYNQVQVLQVSANDLVTTLNLAKSRALSQIKLGTNCSSTNNILDSYEVAITIPSSYSLKVNCHGAANHSDVIYSKNLPKGVSFKDDPDTKPTTFIFPVIVGGVAQVGKITLLAYEREKIITINSLGGVNIQLPILTPKPARTRPTPTPTITPTPVIKRVFVTSRYYNGDLGGLAGADDKCQARADAASLGGTTWKAWLSTSSVNAVDRIYPTGTETNGYKRLDDETVADNKEDLIDGSIDNAIDRDESNEQVNNKVVWTGTKDNGVSAVGDSRCSDWANNSGSGATGGTGAVGKSWTAGDYYNCALGSRLYCFEQ